MVPTCCPRAWELVTGAYGVHSHLWPHREGEVNRGCKRACLSFFFSSRKDLYLKEIKYSTKIISGDTDLLVGIAK